VLVSASGSRKATTKQEGNKAARRISIRPRYLNCVFVLFCYKILLFVDKSICECAQLKEFLNFTILLNIKELLNFTVML
jgi:hypothetical protein